MPPSAGAYDYNQQGRPKSVPIAGTPPVRIRHPLGLPQGSVRALLTFMVLGIISTLLLLPKDRDVHVPLFLEYLMFLILGHYFAARGHAPNTNEPHPLWLPRGSVRFLILFGVAGVLGYAYYLNPETLLERLKPDPNDIAAQPFLPIVLIGCFFLGILVARIAWVTLAGPEGLPAWFQDIIAWVSLLAILGMGAEVIMQLVIKVKLTEVNLDLPNWQTILSGIIAFYFGARS
jgi:hypothetical protein